MRAFRCQRLANNLQEQQGDNYVYSNCDLRSVINVGRDARNIIISRIKECEEVEAYIPSSNYCIPPKAFASFKKYKPVTTRPQGKPWTPHHGETSLGGPRINKTLQCKCFIHPKSSRPLYRLVLSSNSFIQSCKSLLTSNGQGVGLKSQSLSFYNYCNLDKSKIKF